MLVVVGMLGVLLGMFNYWLLVSGRVACSGVVYLGINVAACVLVLSSLFEQFNLPTLMINLFYGGVSIWGLINVRTTARHHRR